MEVFRFIDFGAEHLPERKHCFDAGMDIYSPSTFTLAPGAKCVLPLGFGVMLPIGYMAETKVRGSSAKQGIWVADNPIDTGYTGEVHAVVWNISQEEVTIHKGDRFCQLVITPCTLADMYTIKPQDAPSSERGAGCYGSTGGYNGTESNR